MTSESFAAIIIPAAELAATISSDFIVMEWYRSGHNEHDWKSCDGHKPSEGSNPSHSAMSEQAYVSLAPTFLKVRARSRRCSSFPNRNRLRWVAIWARRYAAVLSRYREISILTAPSSSSQATYRLRRAFSFHCKAHRALILLLLASKPDPLSLGSGLGPPLGGGFVLQ